MRGATNEKKIQNLKRKNPQHLKLFKYLNFSKKNFCELLDEFLELKTLNSNFVPPLIYIFKKNKTSVSLRRFAISNALNLAVSLTYSSEGKVFGKSSAKHDGSTIGFIP